MLAGAGLVVHAGRLHPQGEDSARSRDYGVGVLAFEFSPAPGAELPRADTLVIHRTASEDSPVVGRFLFKSPDSLSWSYALETREAGIASNALEFDYEVLGLPIDSLQVGSEWVRVIYGVAAGTVPLYGWVSTRAGRRQVRLWAEELARHPLFFWPAEGMAFHARPGGERVRFELARRGPAGGAAFDYRLEPLDVEGRWMKVRVVTPNLACTAESADTREAVFWIEYLGERGRPRVWYHTRGC